MPDPVDPATNPPSDQTPSRQQPPPWTARGRRAMWGIAPLAMAPDAWPDEPRRTRLVRATTLTSVMGLAWASTTTWTAGHLPAALPVPVGDEALHHDAVDVAGVGAMSLDMALNTLPFTERVTRKRRDEVLVEPTADPATGDDEEEPDPEADRRPTPEPEPTADAEPTPQAATAAEATPPEPAPDPDAWRRQPIASHEQVTLALPSDQTVMVAFHEASRVGARPLAAASIPDQNHGRHPVPHSPVDDPRRTMVLPSRGRTLDAASAVDVAIPAGALVHAPVTGTVTVVEPYLLYGTYPDNRVVIVPDARPDLRLVMLHMVGMHVRPGDRVEAGHTVVADSANPFPFESQVDHFVAEAFGRATPHVHLELRD